MKVLENKEKTAKMRFYLSWQPQPDSNWCSRLERAVSWASRRWGQNCHCFELIQSKMPPNYNWHGGFCQDKIPPCHIFIILPGLVLRQQVLQLHLLGLIQQLRLRLLRRLVQPVEIQFLCRLHFSASNDHLLNHMFQPLS